MPYYLDGFKGDNEVASWAADLFLSRLPPENVKLTHKQLAEYGFRDWLKPSSNATKPDYFILKWYGAR